MNKKYNFNENFFEKIDTEEKAYFLGFLYADGNVSQQNHIIIQLHNKDEDIIYKFLKAINSNHSPKLILPRNHIRVGLCSKKVSNDLIKLGCFKAKSKILEFPKQEQVPEYLINHFIRGYFDGDGSIWEGKRKKSWVKDKYSKKGFRERIIHNTKFNITGTEDIILKIESILLKNNVIKKFGINRSKKIENCIQLEHSGRIQILKFYNYLYNNCTIFLQRKKIKFEKILNICANIE